MQARWPLPAGHRPPPYETRMTVAKRAPRRSNLPQIVRSRPSLLLLGTLMKTLHAIVALGSACLVIGLTARAARAQPAAGKKTALDDYVARRDPSYSWKLVKTIPGDGVTTFV